MPTFKVTAITPLATHQWFIKARTQHEAFMEVWDTFGENDVKITVSLAH